ncbi:MAG: protein kinase [Bacteroides sp.]|nr:protein kinase [Bacteroides sp.]
MDKSQQDTTDRHYVTDDESSITFNDGDPTAQLDLGGLFSNRFSNIMPVYSSPNGPTEIYAATRYGRRFILKGLKEQYRNDPIYTMALAKEFEIGIQLDHPNIRRTIGIETVDAIGKAIILEYIDGYPLNEIVAAGKLNMMDGRSIIGQIADALGYLHSKQVFHRDLKPSNILVSHLGNAVKVIDFNLSDSDEFIILKNPAGSRKYMAPEQLKAGAVPSAVTDIYSLGVIMKELAAMTGDEELELIAERCTNQNAEKRPQSIPHIKLPAPQPSIAHSLSTFLSSKILTYVMVCICLALTMTIAHLLLNPLS